MMMWIMTGARRNVGKTRVSHALAEILPNAACAKIGRKPPVPGQPENYFTSIDDFYEFLDGLDHCDHFIVESNTLALEGRGDLRVFVDAPKAADNVRGDVAVLKEKAHLVIDAKTDEAQWRRALSQKVPQSELVDRICELFNSQKAYLFFTE